MPNRVAIDTNIFIHLTNQQENPDSHIDQLLIHLAKSDPRLCVDSTRKIGNEYEEKLGPRIRAESEQGLAIYLIRYWMNPDLREEIEVDTQGLLMRRIKDVIPEADEHADRAFVFVSCHGDCALISNDKMHIVGRRSELKSKTRKLRGSNWQILLSREAVEFFCS
jgi:hypothetical protein